MDVSTLQSVTEDLAGFLSEVTGGDLGRPTPWIDRDVGDLYLHLLDQNLSVAADLTGEAAPRGPWPDPTDRAALAADVDGHGGGLEAGYRRTAHLLTDAFSSMTPNEPARRVTEGRGALDVRSHYETQIGTTVLHTWDLARALGLHYEPAEGISQRLLRTLAMTPNLPRPGAPTHGRRAWPDAIDPADAFAGVLTLAGRAT